MRVSRRQQGSRRGLTQLQARQRSELYRDFLGGALLKGYEALQTDDELISNLESIRLWTGREYQLVQRLSETETDGVGGQPLHSQLLAPLVLIRK